MIVSRDTSTSASHATNETYGLTGAARSERWHTVDGEIGTQLRKGGGKGAGARDRGTERDRHAERHRHRRTCGWVHTKVLLIRRP